MTGIISESLRKRNVTLNLVEVEEIETCTDSLSKKYLYMRNSERAIGWILRWETSAGGNLKSCISTGPLSLTEIKEVENEIIKYVQIREFSMETGSIA